ncbi:MAG: type I 3-dehydroquinate dehydratase [Candidatus Peregrinibacteria bacterium]|nr:type I 3-dehydroquinate dehydratase [Candidatus Peregrinibacteria bacterium]
MKICVPIKEKTQKEAEERLLRASGKADLAEVWLDAIKEPDLKKLITRAPLPILVACKRKQEKGSFTASYQAQATLLSAAIDAGAAYVDLPLFMPERVNKKIVQHARRKGTKVIISHHDFKGTPDFSRLTKLADKMKGCGADIIKIATQARTLDDTVRIIALAKHLEGLKIRHILIAMGQKGMLSRILSPTLGGEMMFAVLDQKKKTAPGQLSITDLRSAWSALKLTANR